MTSCFIAITRVEITTQKFRTSSSANFLGSWHISGLKSKSYYEIWTFWLQFGLQMIQFYSFLNVAITRVEITTKVSNFQLR